MMYYYRRKTSKLKWFIAIVLIVAVCFGLYWFYANYFSKIELPHSTQTTPTPIAAEPKTLLGTLYVLAGGVEADINSQGFKTAVNEAILHQGDKIKTNTSGLAVIKLENGGVIRLNNNSEIYISQLNSDGIKILQSTGRSYHLSQTDNYQVSSLGLTVTAKDNIFEVITNSEKKTLAVLNFKNSLVAEVSDSQGLLSALRLAANEKGLIDLNQIKSKIITIESLNRDTVAKEEWYKWNFNLDLHLDEALVVPAQEPDFQVLNDQLQIKAELKDEQVLLNWSVYKADDFTQYQLVRSDSNKDLKYPDETAIKTSAVKTLDNFKDTDVEKGKKYYYRICVIKTNQKVACGNVGEVEIPAPDTIAPTAPNLSASISEKGVLLNWAKSSEADFGQYKILRALNKSNLQPGADVLKTISSQEQNNYLDASLNITSVGNYYYRLCVFDQSGNNSCSQIITIENGQIK